MAICQICGCKTDELDFVKSSVNGYEAEACSFCHRQLSSFSAESVSDAHVRWLKTIAGKDVPLRSAELRTAIDELLLKYGETAELSAPPPVKINEFSQGKINPDYIVASQNQAIADLTKRVEELELQFKILKIKQLRRTIVEIFASIIIAIVILLVFARSGVVISMY